MPVSGQWEEARVHTQKCLKPSHCEATNPTPAPLCHCSRQHWIRGCHCLIMWNAQNNKTKNKSYHSKISAFQTHANTCFILTESITVVGPSNVQLICPNMMAGVFQFLWKQGSSSHLWNLCFQNFGSDLVPKCQSNDVSVACVLTIHSLKFEARILNNVVEEVKSRVCVGEAVVMVQDEALASSGRSAWIPAPRWNRPQRSVGILRGCTVRSHRQARRCVHLHRLVPGTVHHLHTHNHTHAVQEHLTLTSGFEPAASNEPNQ